MFLKISFKYYFAFALLFLYSLSSSQTISNIEFLPKFGKEDLELNKIYTDTNKISGIIIENCKFYVSSISITGPKGNIYTEPYSFHLIDLSDKKTLIIPLKISTPNFYNTIHFNLGIDSLTNSEGVKGGDLDPTKGMYWTWQSGYIQIKLEGNFFYNGISQPFEYHLGGFGGPNNTCIPMIFNLKQDIAWQFTLDLKMFFEDVNYKELNHVMSPGSEAKNLARVFSSCIQLK